VESTRPPLDGRRRRRSESPFLGWGAHLSSTTIFGEASAQSVPIRPTAAARRPVNLEPQSVKVLLGQRVADGTNDSRALAATILYERAAELRNVDVEQFLLWIQGSNDRLVSEYMRAATIPSDAKIGALGAFQRAALIGALRLRRRSG
jgi:hypothetical protein